MSRLPIQVKTKVKADTINFFNIKDEITTNFKKVKEQTLRENALKTVLQYLVSGWTNSLYFSGEIKPFFRNFAGNRKKFRILWGLMIPRVLVE